MKAKSLALAIVLGLVIAFGLMTTRTYAGPVHIITFTAFATKVVGTPFGLTVNVGDAVVVTFSYDVMTPPNAGNVTNNKTFNANISNGFMLSLVGSTITSSSYVLDSVNNANFVFWGTSRCF